MDMDIEIREYRAEDEGAWMRTHAVILSISHAWNYAIQERPRYEGYESTMLVAVAGGEIVGLLDTQYEKEPGEICFLSDSLGGYVLEFGRLPEYAGEGIGKLLIDAAVEHAKEKGVARLEFWTQDRAAQRYYGRLGFTQIGRHQRFRIKAPEAVSEALGKERIGAEYVYCVCTTEEWPSIKEEYEVIEKAPLEPHLCIGYELRF